MTSFPRRSFLYRMAASAVILLTMVGISRFGWSQYARKSKVSTGPRAVGLIQLQSNGKARLIPVAIMVDGKFYDAGSYKADPVPMALDFETVYEGFRTGVSQGLMTITQPGHLKDNWIAEGTWLPAGSKPASSRKKAEIPNIGEKDEPPKLHRKTDKDDQASPTDKKTSANASDKSASTGDQQKTGSTAPPETTKNDEKKPASATASKPDSGSESVDLSRPIDDPNRPVLRRGKPDPNVRRERVKDFDGEASSNSAKAQPSSSAPKDNPLARLIPAISDAGGPDAHSYAYDTRPAEENAFREKMLALASAELRRSNPAYAQGTTAVKSGAQKSSPARSAHKTAVAANIPFSDVQLRIFDLSSSNEPILVLSAKALPPSLPRSTETRLAASQAAPSAPLPQEITLVAKTNLEGELRKMFFSATDAQHLDVAPQMDLIDAVDADGDGRGELLFRRTSDAGSSYAIYRAAADQLWPLYEGTP